MSTTFSDTASVWPFSFSFFLELFPSVILMPFMLHNSQDTSYPPAAGHDDSACWAAPLIVVWPWIVAKKRFTDSLALGVTSSTFNAAYALMVQHGVKSHATFSFQLPLKKNKMIIKSFSCVMQAWECSIHYAILCLHNWNNKLDQIILDKYANLWECNGRECVMLRICCLGGIFKA